MKHCQGRRQGVSQRYFAVAGPIILNLAKLLSGQLDQGICIKIFAHGSFGLFSWQVDSDSVINFAALHDGLPCK